MPSMRAAVITRYGEPEVLRLESRPIPTADSGSVVVRVRAFGLNHAEVYFRRGLWGEVAKVSGIECAGEVHDPGDGPLRRAQRVVALMGGMGRTIDGSYAEFVRVPAAHVIPIESGLDWVPLAALPESYATAWTFLHHNLELRPGQTLFVRGATSALGQAAINIARSLDTRVLGSSRSPEKLGLIERLGAEAILEAPDLSAEVRRTVPDGVDAVLEIVGTRTLLDSLRMARYRGRVAMAGFLGGGDALTAFDPLRQLPSGVQLSFFASAFLFGTPAVPMSEIPFQEFATQTERGVYKAAPSHVFDLEAIVEAHRLMESGAAQGKIVVRVG